MPLGLYNAEWLYQNAVRRYPLTPWANPTDTTGSFTLPDDLIVELYLPISFTLNTNPANYFLQQITTSPTGLSLIIGYSANGTTSQVASTNVSYSALAQEFTPVALPGINSFIATNGKVVFGRLAGIQAQPFGQFNFLPAATPIDVDCIHPQLQCVSGLTVNDGSGTNVVLTGVVNLISGTNMLVEITGGNSIQLNAINGAGLNEDCACTENGTAAKPVVSINGLTADNNGRINLIGDGQCLTVSGSANTIQITDSCSAPCCGCPELEAITSELQNFSTVATTLQNFTAKLQNTVEQMTQVVIGSKIGDNGCVTCS